MFDTIQNMWMFAAAVLAGGCGLLHAVLGGLEIAGPLLRAKDIPDVSKYVNYYCWHLVTITLFAMSASFVWVAFDGAQIGLAVIWTIMAALFCAWSIGLVIWKRQSLWAMPQWILFLPVAITAALGLIS